MTEPRGPSPNSDGDLAALRDLDLALDRLAADPGTTTQGPATAEPAAGPAVAAGSDAPPGAAPVTDQTAALAALAVELRTAVPAPPPGAADRGRAAFLAKAAELRPDGSGAGEAAAENQAGRPDAGEAAAAAFQPGRPDASEAAAGAPSARRRWRRGRGGGSVWRRSLPLRVAALAAALVVLVAVPGAVARQARPGTALWPLRQVGQQVRLGLADDPVHQAHLRLNTAGAYLAAGAGAGEERREEMADRARDEIRAALDTIDDVAGSRADAERERAERLLAEVDALERQRDPDDSSGPGSGSEPDDDRSGRGGDEDRSGGGEDDRSGRGSGDGSGSGSDGSGSGGDDSGSGSGSSGSGSSGSGSGSGSGTSGSGTSGSSDD
jgi:hypothetical protein